MYQPRFPSFYLPSLKIARGIPKQLRSWFTWLLLAAVRAVRASVAALAHAAILAGGEEVRMVEVFGADGTPVDIMQSEMDGASRVVHAGLVRLLATEARTFEVVGLAVFDEPPPRAAEGEPHIGLNAFLPQCLHPFEMARAEALIVFPIAEDLFDLASREVVADADRADEWRAHDAFVLEWQVKQDGDEFVSAFSAVTLKKMLSQPSPQSFGRWSATRSGRFVSRKKMTSGRHAIIDHASSRQASASSRKKSEVMQTRIISPLWIL